jgi:hypothetical protein
MLHGVAIERGAACGDLKSAQSAYRVELKHIRQRCCTCDFLQ